MSLIASMVFNDSFGVETTFIGLMNEIWEVGRVMIQKSCLSDQASVIYAILNQVIPLLALHYQVSHQFSVLHVILNQVVLQWALKPILVAYFRKTKKINLPLTTIMTFFSFGLIVAYSTFTYFISDLMTFIYSALKLCRIT